MEERSPIGSNIIEEETSSMSTAKCEVENEWKQEPMFKNKRKLKGGLWKSKEIPMNNKNHTFEVQELNTIN